MNAFRCGCLTEAVEPDDYCESHRFTACHADQFAGAAAVTGECPNCWRRRMLSVNTDYATIALGRQRERDRRPGIDPKYEVSLAGKDEFPAYLTKHSKVRQ